MTESVTTKNPSPKIIGGPKLAKPPMYAVILHNDDFTPIEFVAALLMYVFKKNETDACMLANDVHNHGTGVAGVYTHGIAETKIAEAMMMAERQEHPLQLTMEPE